jgi:hypothetical protein
MAPEEAPLLQEWIQKFKDAAVGANIVGVFDCQGQASRLIKIVVGFSRNPKVRGSVSSSQGQPDAASLERAKAFANETVNKLKP